MYKTIIPAYEEVKKEFYHFPVMYQEVLQYLNKESSKIVVDCTLGAGGHSFLIYNSLNEPMLFAFERDKRMIQKSLNFLKNKNIDPIILNESYFDPLNINKIQNKNFYIIHKRFSYLVEFLKQINIKVDFLLCDLGISMIHLKEDWGFSFKDETLEMKLDEESLDLDRILNHYSEKDIADIIYKYGEERLSRYIAKEIIKNRPIITGTQLKDTIIKTYYKKFKKHINENVVQKTFQAFRIFINQELQELEFLLSNLHEILNSGGVAVFISFHSLEDRLIKQYFRFWQSKGFNILTKKPVVPSKEEIEINLASRSAKMRVIQCNI